MKKLFFYFLASISSITSYSQLGPNDETFNKATVEYEIDDFYPAFYGSEIVYSPITSYKGSVYFVYIDSSYRPKMGKIDKNGDVSVKFLDDQKPVYSIQLGAGNDGSLPDGHHKFSIAIDKEGYIHVIGDQHNYGSSFGSTREENKTYVDRYLNKHILYWVSEKPEDIDSFIFEGNDENDNERISTIPGNGFTYASFFNDMNGELYVRQRSRVSSAGHYRGEMGWTLAKYDIDNKKWIELGGLSPSDEFPNNYQTLHKSIFWENNGLPLGSEKHWYQPFYGDLVNFDFDNRMHVVTQINNNDNNRSDATDIVYAYSDDQGNTFKKADGTIINELPIRADKGNGQGSIIAGESESSYGYVGGPSISTNKDGVPIVTYSKIIGYTDEGSSILNPNGLYKYWNKETNTWSDEATVPTAGQIRNKTVLDANGITNYIGSDKNGLVFRDNKFTTYEETGYSQSANHWLNGFFTGIDSRGILEQNVLRGFLYDRDEGTLKIVYNEGIPNLSPISEEWKTTQLANTSGENGMYNDIFQLKSTGIFNENFSGEYVNQTIVGDFELEARIINVNYINEDSFAGLMVRESNNEDSSFFGTAVTSYNGVKTISKGASNDAMSIVDDYEPSEWLKIKRTGNMLESYRSDNGKNWEKLDSREIEMTASVTYGLVAGSGNSTDIGHARIDHVSLKELGDNLNDEYLVAHYKFNNDVLDASDNDLNGNNNGISFDSNFGLFGENNTQSYVSVNSNELLKPEAITVSAWIRPNENNTGARGVIKSVDSDGFNNGWRLITNGTNVTARITTDSEKGSEGKTVSGLILNTWNYVTFSYDGNYIKVSINDNEPASIEHSGNIKYANSNSSMIIGNSNGTGYFNGEIDEVKIYNSALDCSSILEAYENEKEYYLNGLIAHYKFNNNVLDSSPNELNGLNNGIIFESSSSANTLTGYFNGNDADMSVSSDELLKPETITVSAWIRPNENNTGARGVIKSVDSDGFNNGWRLITNGTNVTARITTDSEKGSEGKTVNGLITNKWNHIALTYDGNYISLSVNGNKPEPIEHSGSIKYIESSPMIIGSTNGAGNFSGEIDEVKIYNSALDSSSMLETYENEKEYYFSSSLSSKNSINSEVQGVNNIKQDNITITLYPNPTNGAINIMYPDFSGNEDLQIIDTTGRTLVNKKLESVNSIFDISNLESNIYFVKISNPNGKVDVKKIMVK